MSSLQPLPGSKEKSLPKQTDDFDYATLDEETQIVIQQRTWEIKERLRDTAQAIWEIGQKLVDVRNCLSYGQFNSWLLTEFQWSRGTAYNYINVFERFSNYQNFGQLNIAASALYILSAPSTPKEACQEALDSAELGETITYSKAKAIVKQYKKSEREENTSSDVNDNLGEKIAESVPSKTTPTIQWSIGDRVEHPAWGIGEIVKLEGDAGELTNVNRWMGVPINQGFPLIMWKQNNKLWPVKTEELLKTLDFTANNSQPLPNLAQKQISSTALHNLSSDKFPYEILTLHNLSDPELQQMLKEIKEELHNRKHD